MGDDVWLIDEGAYILTLKELCQFASGMKVRLHTPQYNPREIVYDRLRSIHALFQVSNPCVK